MTIPASFQGAAAPTPLGPLLPLSEMAVWCQVTESELAGDPLAATILDAASWRVRTAASQTDWTAQTVPARARQIAGHLAARSYKNPDSIVTEGALGPLGGDRTVEDLARALHLTVAEQEELAALGRLLEAGETGGGDLWVQPLLADSPQVRGDVYLPDSMGGSWWVPYLHPDDFEALG